MNLSKSHQPTNHIKDGLTFLSPKCGLRIGSLFHYHDFPLASTEHVGKINTICIFVPGPCEGQIIQKLDWGRNRFEQASNLYLFLNVNLCSLLFVCFSPPQESAIEYYDSKAESDYVSGISVLRFENGWLNLYWCWFMWNVYTCRV